MRNKKLGFVFQDFLLLDGLTVRDNILLPRIIAGETGGDMEQAADRLCGIFGIGAIRNKYPAEISGGEKQRLAIARAIIKDAPIYIFDDSFSALDFKTDAALRRALSTYTKDSAVLIVAQRVSTIMNAEQIIVLDEGKIVGKGTHKELLRTCKTYLEIAQSQLSEEELA